MEGIIPAEVLKRAEQEIQQNYREITLEKFRDQEKFIVRIYLPNLGEQRLVADYQSQIFSKLLIDRDSDIQTKKELDKILEKRGIWTSIDDKKVEDLRTKLTNVEIEVVKERGKKNPRPDAVAAYKTEYDSIRTNLIEKIMEQEGYYSHTVDKKAESQGNVYKAVLCIKDESDKCLWDSIESLNKESNNNAIVTMLSEANMFWSGLNREVLDMLPEKLFDMTSGAEDLEKLQDNEDGNTSTE